MEKIEWQDRIKNLSRSWFPVYHAFDLFIGKSIGAGLGMKNESNIFSFSAEDDTNMYVHDISLLYTEYTSYVL